LAYSSFLTIQTQEFGLTYDDMRYTRLFKQNGEFTVIEQRKIHERYQR